MSKVSLYKTLSPPKYYIVEGGFSLDKLPSGAELVLAPTADTREEALTEIDRFMGVPPYLDVRNIFQAALKSGLQPSEAVRKVHNEIGEISGAVWPEHFHDALGIDRSDIASLFIAWWPTDETEMKDVEFNKRIYSLAKNV
jgi:hypothetical protein